MTTRTFIRTAIGFVFLPSAALPLHAGNPPPGEKAKIEALIGHLETLSGATFIRNGSDYDAKSAAKFLRGKWQAHEKEIQTAGDFIAKAATVSSTTGKPYLIRFKDGTRTKCGDYLTARLKKLEAAPADKPE